MHQTIGLLYCLLVLPLLLNPFIWMIILIDVLILVTPVNLLSQRIPLWLISMIITLSLCFVIRLS